ncbi:LysM peptidoglycan-binding domain-containing protein [Metabacillus idriensis]|uniref:LysM peptidoglycan-binding domain-containing protein n=1 Tax=Metabacillus idriensis TaxID=324768 RepID=UPI002814404E|nr:LysM peptidoglycan-binding domain-containing protein [Metabacillus idriensis]MDR0138565.1 LysM peptidoglycan-binding domain-containing protein [Metabacillus idriensis]
MSKNEEPASSRASRKNKIDEYKSRTGSYPSRSELHKKKDKKKSKYKYPAISILALFFFLLPIVFYYIISYFDDRSKTVNGENISDYEDVLIKYGDEEEEEEQSSDDQSLEESETKSQEADQASVSSAETTVKTDAAPQQISEPEPEKTQPEPKPEPEPEPKEEYKVIEHTVGPEENLFRISVKYYSDRSGEALIKQWNQLSGDGVYEGQVLKIPIKQ